MLRKPKRGSYQVEKIKTKWKESMKTNEKMMSMTNMMSMTMKRVNDRGCGKIFQCFRVLHTWGNIIRVFEPFISFLSITWTRPTLQPLNKALLEVLLIESTHLALMIFSFGLRRKTVQDYQAPLADIFKRQISQILKWPNFFSNPQTITLLTPNRK